MLALLGLVACSPPVEDVWTARRETCGLGPGEVRAFPNDALDAERDVTYDEACARAIGDDLGMAWDDLPPSTLTGPPNGDVVAKVIAGAWMYLAGDFGSIGALRADPAAPEALVEELADVQRAVEAPDEAPASRVLYDWIAHHVVVTRPWDERVVAFSREDGALLVWDQPDEMDWDPWLWVGNLGHEVWHHRADASHVDCETGARVEGGKDRRWSSAYGAELYLGVRLLDHMPETVLAARPVEAEAVRRSGNFCPGTDLPERYR